MKTVREYLESFPEPFRSKALSNMESYASLNTGDMMQESEHDAIQTAFSWSVTPEGYEFWRDLYYHLAYHRLNNLEVLKPIEVIPLTILNLKKTLLDIAKDCSIHKIAFTREIAEKFKIKL